MLTHASFSTSKLLFQLFSNSCMPIGKEQQLQQLLVQ